MTYFDTVSHKFMPVPSTGQVSVELFLLAAKDILPFFDTLGVLFKPLKSDLAWNINVLETKWLQHPVEIQIFHDLIECEMRKLQPESCLKSSPIILSLLWLKRSLQFIAAFLEELVNDHHNETTTDSLHTVCTNAYQKTLKMYHGWFVQRLVVIFFHAAPKRSHILKSLACGKENMEAVVISSTEAYVAVLNDNLDHLKELLEDNNLDFNDKINTYSF